MNESAPNVSSFSAITWPCGSRISSSESSGEPSRAANTSQETVCPFFSVTVHSVDVLAAAESMRTPLTSVSGSFTPPVGTESPSISCSTISGNSPTWNSSPDAAPSAVHKQSRGRRPSSGAFSAIWIGAAHILRIVFGLRCESGSGAAAAFLEPGGARSLQYLGRFDAGAERLEGGQD